MGLPIVPIVTSLAPLAMKAYELYRRRSEAEGVGFAAGRPAATGVASGDALQRRLQALEESDLEQARLLSDLSKQVEALARAMESQLQAGRAREARLRGWLIGAVGLALLAALVSVWALVR